MPTTGRSISGLIRWAEVVPDPVSRKRGGHPPPVSLRDFRSIGGTNQIVTATSSANPMCIGMIAYAGRSQKVSGAINRSRKLGP
jgi:hypothetical protein